MDLMRVTLEYLVKKGAISLESTVALIPQSYQIDTVSRPIEFLANLQKYSFFNPVPLQDLVSSVIVMVATVRMFFLVITLGPSHPSRPKRRAHHNENKINKKGTEKGPVFFGLFFS
jgi:hypothetical protein